MININNTEKEYYSEDEIITLRDHMDSLKGKILLDDNNNLFIFIEYFIQSITHKKGFLNKKEVTEFYIDWITIQSGDESHEVVKHTDNNFCTIHGVTTLMEYHANWSRLEANLVKLTTNHGISLNFNPMVLS